MLASIFVFLAVAVLIVIARAMLNGEDAVKTHSYVTAVEVGIIVGLVNYFSPRLSDGAMWLSWILMVVMLIFFVLLAAWWRQEGGEWKEMIPFALLALVFVFPAKAAAASVASLVESVPFATFIAVLPTLFFVGVLGYFVSSHLWFLYSEVDRIRRGDTPEEKQQKQQKQQLRKTLSILAGVATVLVLAFVCWTNIDWSAPDVEAIDDSTVVADEIGGDEIFLQNWVDNGNNRLDNEFAAKLAEKAKAEDGEITADIVEETVLENCGHDARLLAIWANAFALWDDPNNYEPLLTEDKTYLSEEGIQLYYKLEGYLKAVKVVREEAPADGTNTGYSDGYVVAESAGISGDRTGTKFTSPDSSVEPFWLMDRCSNLVYKKTPKKVPKGPTDENPKGPKYNKDPNKAPKTDTELNDDKGSGSDTNNPKDPNHSSKDTKDSSTSGSYKDYKDDVKEKKETNQNQKTGNDSNTPSTPKPSPKANVDNNGDSGTGNGGINKPTPTKPKAKEADTGKEINSNPGEAWEGPAD